MCSHVIQQTAIIYNENNYILYILKYSNFHSRIKNSTHHCQKGVFITQYLWHSTRSPTSPFFCPTFFTAAILLASGFPTKSSQDKGNFSVRSCPEKNDPEWKPALRRWPQQTSEVLYCDDAHPCLNKRAWQGEIKDHVYKRQLLCFQHRFLSLTFSPLVVDYHWSDPYPFACMALIG